MVGTLDDFHVVLDDENGMAALDEGVEGLQQALDVMKMEAGGGLVEDEERGFLLLLSDEIGQLDALVFTTREGAAVLAELDVAKTHILEGLEALHDGFQQLAFGFWLLATVAEELDGLGDGHIEDVVDILATIAHIENVVLEAVAVTGFALQHEVGHKLHLDGDDTGTLALVAATAVGIEREILTGEAHLLGQGLVGKEVANGVVGLDIGGGVRTRGLADGILVDKLDMADGLIVALKTLIFARGIGHIAEVALESRKKDALDEGALAGAGNACDNGHDIERKADVNALEIVHAGTLDGDDTIPGATARRNGDGVEAREVAEGVASASITSATSLTRDTICISLKDDFATEATGIRSDIDEVVGSTHNLFVVLDNDNSIALVAQFLENMDESVGVAGMETNAGFVEDIERAHEGAAQRGGEVDALALATREAVGHSVQREIAQSDVQEELQAGIDFSKQAMTYLLFLFRQFQGVEPLLEAHNGQLDEVGDASATNLHIVGLGLEARAVTLGTDRLATIARQHDAILNLILVVAHHLKEAVDGHAVVFVTMLVGRQAMPQHVLLLLRQVIVRLENGETHSIGITVFFFCCATAELVFPHAHLLAVPRLHTTVVDGQRGIGNNQVLVDADDHAETLTLRTGADGRIKGEELVGGLFERHAVGLEALGEVIGNARRVNHQAQLAMALVESGLCGVDEARNGVLAVIGREAVDDEVYLSGKTAGCSISQVIVNSNDIPVDEDAGIAILLIHLQLTLHGAALDGMDGRHDNKLGARLILRDTLDDVLGGVLLHLLTGDRRIGAPNAGEEQAQVLVDFRRGAYGAAGIARDDFLLDGDGRRNAANVVALGLVHAAQKLAGIAREALDIATLPFGIEGVESQRRLAAARDTGNDDELVAGNLDADILEIVDSGALDFYAVFHLTRTLLYIEGLLGGDADLDGMQQQLLPRAEAGKPLLGRVIAEGLVVAAEGDEVVQTAVDGLDDEGIVVLIGHQLLGNILTGNANAQTYRLAFVAQRILDTDRPVAAPAATKALVVGELLGILDVDKTSGEERLNECRRDGGLDSHIAMAGIEDIEGAQGEALRLGGGFPIGIDDFENGAQRPTTDEAHGALVNIGEHLRVLTVPTTQGTTAKAATHPQHIVAIAGSLLHRIGIELRLLQLQTLAVFAVEVDGLAMVEIEAVGHQLALESGTVVVKRTIGIGTLINRQAGDEEVLLVLALDLPVDKHHVSIDLCLVLAGLAIRRQLHGEALPLLLANVGEEAELVKDTVAIEVVQLAGHFPTLLCHQRRTHNIGGILFQVQHDGFVLTIQTERIGHRNFEGALGHDTQRGNGQ